MLNLLFCFIYFLQFLFFDLTDAAAYILPAQPKPEKFACKKGCYQPDLDTVLAYNETFSPQDGKSCKQYSCSVDGSTGIYTCGAIDFPNYCTKVPGNQFLPYPKCCDGVSCPPVTPSENTTVEEPTPIADAEETQPNKSDDQSNFGPPDNVPLEKSSPKSTDTDNSTDIPVGAPKPCPTCPKPPKPPVPESDNQNDIDNSESDSPNAPLNHGPVYKLPVEPPSVSRAIESNAEGPIPPVDPSCTYYPPLNPDDSPIQDTNNSGKPRCPPWAGPPVRELADSTTTTSSENPPLYHGPVYTNPVEPPVTSIS